MGGLTSNGVVDPPDRQERFADTDVLPTVNQHRYNMQRYILNGTVAFGQTLTLMFVC
jgi:hypothetical protein